jgi:hypothetical protein
MVVGGVILFRSCLLPQRKRPGIMIMHYMQCPLGWALRSLTLEGLLIIGFDWTSA